ncbi:MAG: signal peptide peptidase SppA [Desulfuromonas sp.]|nr:signal peptide peptidase SppA [Desulfuromonas sp.]
MKKRPFIFAAGILALILIVFGAATLLLSNDGPKTFALGAKIGVVDIKGAINESRSIIDDLQDFSENDSIKAIVLRVNSPGGGVGPSQEIHDEIDKIVKIKPVIVSMGSVAASGGYYVSAPATEIYANPGTITGSIGVIMEFTNVLQLMDKIGLKSSVVKSGIHKDIGSAMRDMTPEERQLLQSLIDDVYSQFVEAVSSGRHLPEDEVRQLADGRIFTGRQALKLGLVDKLGGLQAAIAAAAQRVGIKGKPTVVYPAQPKKDLVDYFVGQTVTHINEYMAKQYNSGLKLMWSPAN